VSANPKIRPDLTNSSLPSQAHHLAGPSPGNSPQAALTDLPAAMMKAVIISGFRSCQRSFWKNAAAAVPGWSSVWKSFQADSVSVMDIPKFPNFKKAHSKEYGASEIVLFCCVSFFIFWQYLQ
jgi:hypothetical protein